MTEEINPHKRLNKSFRFPEQLVPFSGTVGALLLIVALLATMVAG